MTYTTLWLIIAGACLIAEVFTVGFLLFFPGIGAIIAFIAALLGASFTTQIIIFVISTILLIIFIRPIIAKMFKSKELTPMNSNSLIGKNGIVLKTIDGEQKGQVKVAGEIWSAICNDGQIIEENSKIIVKEIKGVKLFVDKVN